jgi:hypothetical protein
MSNSLLESLAAMLQGTSEPKAQVDDRPVIKGSAFELIRLLNSKQYNREAVVTDSNGIAVACEDGGPLTFGELAFREANVVRQDGTVGANYPIVWSLTQGQASGAINSLKSELDKPKGSTAKPSKKGNFAKKSSSNAGTSSPEMAAVAALLQQLIAGQAAAEQQDEPAKPVATPGHRKVARPGTIAAQRFGVSRLTEGDLDSTELAEGQIVAFGTRSCGRVTVHASGKPAFRKTII